MSTRSVSSSRFLVARTTQKSLLFSSDGQIVDIVASANQKSSSLISVAFWVKLNVIRGGVNQIMFNQYDSLGNTMHFGINMFGSDLYIQYRHTVSGKNRFSQLTKRFPLGTYIHMVATYDGSSVANQPLLYINAALITTAQETAPTGTRSTAGNISFGDIAAANGWLDGNLKDVRIFNRILTLSEIQNIYYKSQNPSDNSCVGLYKMDENTGATIVDATGNANGTITGATWSSEVPPHMNVRSAATNRFLLPTTAQKSMLFNGSSDYATVPIIPDPTGFSVGLWWYNYGKTGLNDMFVAYSNAFNNGFSLIRGSTGLVNFNIQDAVGTQGGTARECPLGWNHIAATYKSGEMKLYINSIVSTYAPPRDMGVPTGDQIMTLGKRSSSATYIKEIIQKFTFQNTTTPWTQAQIDNLCFRNVIPSGAKQYSMNNVATDQDGANALTLVGTSYSTLSPLQPRSSV